MKLSKKKIKRLLAGSMALTTLGVASMMLQPTETHAVSWQEQKQPASFTPAANGNTRFAGANATHTGTEWGYYHKYQAKNGITGTYRNVGYYNGVSVDMKIKVTNMSSNVKGVYFYCDNLSTMQTEGMGVALGGKGGTTMSVAGYSGRIGMDAEADLEIWFVASGTEKKLNMDSIALAMLDLEPYSFYLNGQRRLSLNQSMKVTSGQPLFATAFTDNGYTVIDKDLVRGENKFTTKKDTRDVPRNQVIDIFGSETDFVQKWDGASAILGYKPNSRGSITFKLHGNSSGIDLFMLSGKKIPISNKQPAPVKYVSKASSNSGYSKTETTLDTVEKPFYYKITQEVKLDNVHSGKGFKVEDALPPEVKIKKVTAVQSGMWDTNVSGQKVTFTAKQDVYKAPNTYTFLVEGTVNVDRLTTTGYFDNTAKSVTTPGSSGGGNSNTVKVKVPKRTITINYYDFDNQTTKLIPSTVKKDVPVGVPYTFTPPGSITPSNKKTYTLVEGPTNGKLTTPKTITDKSTTNKTYDFYYRTKWKYYVLHEEEGKKPAINSTISKDGPLIKQETGEVYLKTDDGKKLNTITGVPDQTLKTSKGHTWFALNTRKTQEVQPKDDQLIRLDYKVFKPNADIDWIKLDVAPAGGKKIPLEYQWTFKGLDNEPLIDTKGLTGDALKDAEATNNMYKNALDNLKYTVTFDNLITDVKGYEKTGKYRDHTGANPTVKMTQQTIEDNKLAKATTQKIKMDITFSGTNDFDLQTPKSAQTFVETATEKQLTNRDIVEGKGQVEYKAQARTVLDARKNQLHTFLEKYIVKFKRAVSQKTGYYDVGDFDISVASDIEKVPGLSDMTSTVPKEFLTGDGNDTLKTAPEFDQDKGQITMELNGTKTVNSEKQPTLDLAGLDKWEAKTYSTKGQYPHVYVEQRTGNLFSQAQVDAQDSQIKNNILDGGNRFYFPIWLDVDNYEGVFESSDGTNKKTFGQNLVSFKFDKKFKIFAQMYSDESSKTKDKDELYVQPVFADEDYEHKSDLSSKGREWVSKADTNNATN